MVQRFMAVTTLCIALSAGAISNGQTGTAKSPAAAELALQGKIAEAVRVARKSPSGAAETVRGLCERADIQITERQFKDAQATLSAAEKFLSSYAKGTKSKSLPSEPLKGRNLRLQGILLNEQKEFDKALALLKEALEIGKQAKDLTLEAGVRNNIGYALDSQGKHEEASKEFIAARDIAEGQKDNLRAGSYNFNLGWAHYQLRKWDPAFDAFKRAGEQSRAASKPSLEARATLYQGRTLSNLNSVSPEAMKYFVNAQKLYDKLGDQRNSAWCFYLMGDHTAYTLDFGRAAYYAEQALAGFTAVGDKEWLRRCYEFLAEMYGRAGKKDKAEEYKKKAQEISQSKG